MASNYHQRTGGNQGDTRTKADSRVTRSAQLKALWPEVGRLRTQLRHFAKKKAQPQSSTPLTRVYSNQCARHYRTSRASWTKEHTLHAHSDQELRCTMIQVCDVACALEVHDMKMLT